MLTEAIMHDCVVKLLKNHDAESLECLCRLLTTIGKDLDFEKAKVSQVDPNREDVDLYNGQSFNCFCNPWKCTETVAYFNVIMQRNLCWPLSALIN